MFRVFDYRCGDCESVEERLVGSEDQSPIVCSHCDGEMIRVISAPRVLKPGGEEGQALKAIHEIQNKDRSNKIYSRP